MQFLHLTLWNKYDESPFLNFILCRAMISLKYYDAYKLRECLNFLV